MSDIPTQLAPFRVEAPANVRLRRYRKLDGRCYELAGMFALDNADSVVVHGIVFDNMAHAWAEVGELVYDGTAGGLFSLTDYYRVTGAVPVRKFQNTEFAKWVSKAGHWGPCDELIRHLGSDGGNAIKTDEEPGARSRG